MSEIHDAGRLEDHPFAELAGLIFRESRTGELTLEDGQRRRSVWFLGGNPVAVLSSDPRDHLAQFLLEHGRIGAQDAERLAALPETREALGAADYLPKETLTWGVKSRFVNLCYDLFRWEGGDYAFRDGDPPRDLFLLKVPAHSLILKGAGFVSSATVREKVPDDAVCGPGPVPAGDAHHLGPEAQRLLAECRPGRSVAEAVGDGWDDPEQARRTLYALQCLGLVSMTPAPPAPAAAPELAEPGFSFDDGFGQSDLTEAAPEGAALITDEGVAPGEEPVAAGGDFNLPPFDEAPPGLGDTDSINFPPGTPPPGGYPFESEPSAGAFGSFGSDLNLEREEQEPRTGARTPPGRAKKAAAQARTSRFRLPNLPRIAGVIVGGIAAAALIGGAAWWWMGGGEPPPQPTPVMPPVKRPAPVPAPPPAPGAPAPAETAAPAPAAPGGGAPAATPAPPPPPAPSTAAPAPQPAAAAPAPAGAGDRYRNALDVFRAGDLDGAAAILESVLAEEHRDAFTLLLLTACQPETIRDAERTLSSQRLFLVTKKVNGRDCFRVCIGTFASRDEAARALAGLPSDFRSAGASVRAVADVLKRDR